MNVQPTRNVRLAAVGDLLLAPPPAGMHYHRDPMLVSSRVRELFEDCDIVFANLECTLEGDGDHLSTEPLVITDPSMICAVKESGFTLVTLANNHAFDCYQAGFCRLRGFLDDTELPHFGAGLDGREAVAPLIVDCDGLRIAFLAAVDERSGASHFAEEGQFGVARLDVPKLKQQIRDLLCLVHHVIISVHWGEERFLIPAPEQVAQAHAIVDAGASMVLGHHPHVIQGMELHRDRPILYSLGNFVADEVYFSNGDAVRWDRTGRTGCILVAELTRDEVQKVRLIPTYDSGAVVDFDNSGFGQRRIDVTTRAIARGVSPGRYRREHVYVKTIRPALKQMHWSNWHRFRWHKIGRAFRSLTSARSAK